MKQNLRERGREYPHTEVSQKSHDVDPSPIL